MDPTADTALQWDVKRVNTLYASRNLAAYYVVIRKVLYSGVVPVQHLAEHLSKLAITELALGQLHDAVSQICRALSVM